VNPWGNLCALRDFQVKCGLTSKPESVRKPRGFFYIFLLQQRAKEGKSKIFNLGIR